MVDYSLLPGSLDLFELMVNYVAGGIFLSLVIWGIILLITGIMGRMSFQSIAIILGTYFAVSMVGYLGAFASVPIFLLALAYLVWGVYDRWLR